MKYYYRRHLPHFVVDEAFYFITSRLSGSLPNSVIQKLRKNFENELIKLTQIKDHKTKNQKYEELLWNYFLKFDEKLDDFDKGPTWMGEDSIAELVADSIHHRDGDQYELIAYVIMPNHIHLVINPDFEKIMSKSDFSKEYPLGELMYSFKRYTAAKSNKILSRKGAFWQHENFDHIIRDAEELKKIVKYVLYNPVKAKLCKTLEEYKWSYYNPDLM